jgi:catecholate siderophore receptor
VSVSTLRAAPRAGAVLAATLASVAFPAIAHADEGHAGDSYDGDQIVVVGQRPDDANPNADETAPYKIDRSADGKFTEPLRDTAKSITVIPKEVIEDMGANSFREVVRSTPGVTLGTGEGGNAFGDRIFIRGFEARGDVYIDGLRDPGVTSREIFAVEQIEVVKGPSSTFGGRGTTGGLVSLQSKQPKPGKDFLVGEAGIGTENYYRATIDANYALSDALAIRINGLYHNADTPGRDHVGSKRYGIAAAVLAQPTDTLSIAFDAYHYRLDGVPDYGHPFDRTTQRPFDLPQANFYGAIGRDFLKNGADVATLTLRWEPSDAVALRSTTRYGDTYNYYVVSVPRAPDASAPDPADWTVSTGSPQRHGDNETWAHLTDATVRTTTGGIEHTLVAGFELADETVTNGRYAFPDTIEDADGNIISTPGGFTRNLFDPDPVLGYTIRARLDDSQPPTVARVKTIGLYAIDTLKFSDALRALVGVRYDHFDIDLSGYDGRAATSYQRSSKLGFLNWQASLVYKPVEAASLYASFSTSSNPSGEQLDSSSASYGGLGDGTEGLDPERNTAFELGAKYELGDLLLTGAVFQISKRNAREQVAPNSFELVGKLRARGVEIGASGNVTPRWQVFGGATWLDAEITESDDPANVGSRFPNVPRFNASLLSTYALTGRLQVGGQAYYQSALRGGTYAATPATVPGYWRFDAVARYRVSNAVEARINVLNLTDKRYYDAIYRSSAPFAYVAPGRSAMLTVTARF